MDHVVLVIHLILTLALIVLILLQRSEGGGLGLGTGGGGLGNFASAKSTANALTKATTFVAIGFFATSIFLAILASRNSSPTSILDAVAESPAVETAPSVPLVDGEAAVLAPENEEPPTVPIAK